MVINSRHNRADYSYLSPLEESFLDLFSKKKQFFEIKMMDEGRLLFLTFFQLF